MNEVVSENLIDIYTCSLQSGSCGNAIYVETPDVRLLFDAGIPGKTAKERLATYDRKIENVDALIISHYHSDHTSGAGVFQRKFKMPIYMTPKCFDKCHQKIGVLNKVFYYHPGQILSFGDTKVHTILTAHDAIETVAFIIEVNDKRLGIFTDLGHCFKGLAEAISPLDGIYLESNYCPEMLSESDYPQWLKSRITGNGGHISNQEATRLITKVKPNLSFLVLAHLSEYNNCIDLALETMLDGANPYFDVHVAPRDGVGKMLTL